jgi:hypothetical protein
MAANTGAVTKTGTIGQGAESTTISGSTQNIGAGLGATGEDGVGYGPEFTVTFSTNPGILKSIELDTREINNKGTPEYWVANVRQGQFHSRYSHNLGRVNTLIYGSKLVYTNSDWSTAAPVNTMVKIGGQEAVVAATPGAHAIELSEPYLGASILPVTTDVGTTASAIAASSITVVAPGTTIIANHLKSGAKLMVGGCPIYSDDTAVAVTDTSVSIVAHDCHTDITTSAQIVYRRSDDPSNQNLYKTTGDTAAPTQSLQLVRGSPNVYIVDASITDLVKQYAGATSTFTTSATTATIAANDAFFVNGRGPMKAGTGGLTGSKIIAVKSGEAGIDGPESSSQPTSVVPTPSSPSPRPSPTRRICTPAPSSSSPAAATRSNLSALPLADKQTTGSLSPRTGPVVSSSKFAPPASQLVRPLPRSASLPARR